MEIIDSTGASVVKYTYNAWGRCRSTGNSTIASINPYRYRGYYYDTESGFYFLQTRYYDPYTGRFLSMDDVEYIDPEANGGVNLFAYCNNNPVMGVDPTGHSLLAILGGFAISALVGWAVGELFGEQIVSGVSSVVNGGTAIATGISLLAFGPVGMIAGGLLMLLGIGTASFGVNEIVDGITGTNYIQKWTGMSDGLYGGLYAGLNIASSIGSIAGNMYVSHIRSSALRGLDNAVYGPQASKHIGERSYYDSVLTKREIVKYGRIKKAKYGVHGVEFTIKGYTSMGKSGKTNYGTWSLVYGDGVIWHFLLK